MAQWTVNLNYYNCDIVKRFYSVKCTFSQKKAQKNGLNIIEWILENILKCI